MLYGLCYGFCFIFYFMKSFYSVRFFLIIMWEHRSVLAMVVILYEVFLINFDSVIHNTMIILHKYFHE